MSGCSFNLIQAANSGIHGVLLCLAGNLEIWWWFCMVCFLLQFLPEHHTMEWKKKYNLGLIELLERNWFAIRLYLVIYTVYFPFNKCWPQFAFLPADTAFLCVRNCGNCFATVAHPRCMCKEPMFEWAENPWPLWLSLKSILKLTGNGRALAKQTYAGCAHKRTHSAGR